MKGKPQQALPQFPGDYNADALGRLKLIRDESTDAGAELDEDFKKCKEEIHAVMKFFGEDPKSKVGDFFNSLYRDAEPRARDPSGDDSGLLMMW